MALTKRQRRPDPIMTPELVASKVDEGIYHALQPLDDMQHQQENHWGVGRLIKLVSPESAAKYGSAKAKLDQAIKDRDATQVAHRASVMMRGLAALGKEATAAGHKPLQIDAWLCGNEVEKIFICKDDASASALSRQKDIAGAEVYSASEIARIVSAWKNRTGVDEVKNAFPGATVTGIDGNPDWKTYDWSQGDDIPF